ncbi:MAG: 16S rRNA (cytosine(1402)-N(4))-methyltransferase RsmH [Elusimicrobia bacterium]|nr:16S rRNA (cytosine(1402)-N(4))-methyltransferase RsmH [Elusimicrobiota bacterium]
MGTVPICAGVILRSGMVLLCRRAPGRTRAGLWEFPGGRVEEGETPAEALRRELREELGIEAVIGAQAGRVRHLYDDGEIELIALLVTAFTGELTLKDHDQARWVESRRLLEFDLAPADVPIAKALASHRRRGRYAGTHPRRFGEKYKEHAADPEAVAKAKSRGSTPAGTHLPVMLAETLAALSPLAGADVLDCTLGWGGHAAEIARLGGRVVGLDRDAEELARAVKRLAEAGLVVTARHFDYADALAAAAGLGLRGFDALLADLGVSSMQLDRPERGMSFKNDGPLDMRMDRSRGKTAADWLACATQPRIAEALRDYGDEPDAEKIAAALAGLARQGRVPRTTFELVAAVGSAKGLGPGPFRKKDAFAAHPAARVFQALRIAVNSELDSLKALLAGLPALMRPRGRVALITFHSGEERLVKDALDAQAAAGVWAAPPGPPARPAPEEVRENPRARSARLWSAVRAFYRGARDSFAA